MGVHAHPFGVFVVAELPQTPEDDPQKRYGYAWKADELVTVCTCV